MHTRVPAADTAGRSYYLPPFPPTQSIRDSTDDLYLTVIQGPDSSSISSRGSDQSFSGIKNAVKRVGKRRRINVEGDVQRFEGAAQRRSYFSSASRRELIQFGPEVCALCSHG